MLHVDLQKMFVTIRVVLLLDKFVFHCLSHRLLASYSTNRKHYTEIGDKCSSEQTLRVGVAQGSALGPLQYQKFVQLKSRYFMFAYDAVLVYYAKSGDELEEVVNGDLDFYYKWLCNNRLSVNTNKTVYMVINLNGKECYHQLLKLNNTVLKEVTTHKYLGHTISNKLS